MDGVLVVDKPSGLTSHDVVAIARRSLNERRIGHTGTLDPLATRVLPLACGRVTRLVRFLAASDKEYEAEIRFGLSTDTFDVTGREVTRSETAPSRDALVAALGTLSGEYMQAPPPFSAKRIAGKRAYDLARSAASGVSRTSSEPVASGSSWKLPQPAAVAVRVSRLDLVAFDGVVGVVQLTCSAGFYVRSLAHALGEQLGTGACLQALRRTRSGQFSAGDTVSLATLVSDPQGALARVIAMERLLRHLPSVTLTVEGEKMVSHGRDIHRPQVAVADAFPEGGPCVRVFSSSGALIALGEPGEAPGSLHPSVVLI